MSAYYTVNPDELKRWQQYARANFPSLCQPRQKESHKGSFGTLGIIGGSMGMSGAIVLAGSAALKTGCGKVWLGFHQDTLPLPLLLNQPELMLSVARDLLARKDIDVWAVGCGLGVSESSRLLLNDLLPIHQPMVLDADALNLLAKHANLAEKIRSRKAPTVITPHPGEAARLLDCHVFDVQANRQSAVFELSKQYNACVVLKGSSSLIASHAEFIASHTGGVARNTSGNPGLATAGSGDVLTGIIGSLLTQMLNTPMRNTHFSPSWEHWSKEKLSGAYFKEVVASVWLHGLAADVLVMNGVGPVGLTAGEIADAARWLRNRLAEQ
ncbi:NAD(P)H-hydrate dehydratase [Stenoxybacter acetivorans]|uniref:NAD(P)H-hydrate dehydratase n=1 Tax=Stenoxybacter acetivorans TaxID=422441 RepID=UPI000AF356F0|nr:NAD(P)H-hydrate dehydratase [Stenoxybacter acetivorans]